MQLFSRPIKAISLMLTVALIASMLVGPVTVSAATPDFILENVVVPTTTVDKGTTFTVSFNLKNISSETMTEIYLDMDSTSFSRSGSGTVKKVSDSMNPGDSVAVTMTLICTNVNSNIIPLTISYLDSGSIAKTVNEQILVTLATQVTPTAAKEVATSTYQPQLNLIAGDILTVNAGNSIQSNITFKNVSSYSAKNINITPQLPDSLSGKVVFNSAYLSPQNATMDASTQLVFSLNVTVTDLNLSGTYPITYKIEYMNAYNDRFTTTVNGLLKIVPSTSTTGIGVTLVKMTPAQIVRDEIVTLSFDLKNKISGTSTEITAWIDGYDSSAFQYQGQTQKQSTQLAAGATKNMSFSYKVNKNAPEGSYAYTLHVSYLDGNKNVITAAYDYYMILQPETTLKGNLEIMNMILPKSGIIGEKAFQVSFDLVNTGENDIEDITVNFSGTQELWAQSQSIIQVKKMAAGETKTLTFSLMGGKQTDSKNIPISFAVSYDDKAGDEVEMKSFTASNGILILAAGDETPTSPKILVTRFTTEPVDVSPGSTFDLDFSIQNTNLEKSIKNVKMTLTSSGGGSAASTTSNIIPVGQSESLFVSALGVGETAQQQMKLMIPSDYSSTVCDIKISFSFEDSDGVIYQDQETIHIPMSEKLELTASDVRVGKVLADSYTLELDFYNTGKAMLKNLMVDLEGDFASTNSNYFVGDLQTGKMDIYSVNITGEIPTSFKGAIVFTYEDYNGKQVEKKVPFDLTYEQPKPTAEETAALEAEQLAMQRPAINPLIPVVLVVVVVGIVGTVIYRRKKGKAE